MQTHALHLAVVGHTNTGKTSLMRTLLRDSGFGEVKNQAATTRHVERAAIGDGSETLVYLYDTPGLEDAGGLLDWLEKHTSGRADGIDRIREFLDSPEAEDEFNQEAKVLRQLLQSDTALYVVDAREPVLDKYRDELTVLSWCAKPVMPVFNFTGGQDLSAWTAMLARRTLHVYSGFDTVAFDFEGEIRLWENLASMLPHREILDRLTAARRRDWQTLDEQARLETAYFLLGVAAFRLETDADEKGAAEQAAETMQQAVRQAEKEFQQRLARLYRFYQNQIDGGVWAAKTLTKDPFDADLLKEYGIRTGTGAATGALIGLGIDVLTLGGSLGLGTALGSVLGGVLPNLQSISDKLNGKQTVFIDAETVAVLAARARELLHTLQTRGHAAQYNIRTAGHSDIRPKYGQMPSEIGKARHYPKWSPLNGYDEAFSRSECSETAAALAEKLK